MKKYILILLLIICSLSFAPPAQAYTCQLWITIDSCSLVVGGTTRLYVDGLAGASQGTIKNVTYRSSDPSSVSISPTSSSTRISFPVTVTGIRATSNNITFSATSTLDDGTVCPTVTNLSEPTCLTVTAPTNTPTPTPTPTTIPTPTLTSTPTHTPTPTTTITPAPTVTPIPGIYTIIGNIFTDINNNGIKDPGEDYVGPATITSSAGNPSYASSNGIYQIISLPAGFVTIHFSGPLTTGYSFSYPFPVDQSLTVGVGPCSLLPPNASCPDGNDIETLDISVEIASAAPPWIQSVGTDLRWDKDSSFSNPLPSATTYTSVPATADSMPGIIFSGGKNGVSPSFGTNGGSASQTSWQVGSSAYPDVFTDTHNSIPTSYGFLSETADSSGINPSTISSIGNTSSPGYYKTSNSLTINTPVTFSSGNSVIFVNGDLIINKNIIIPKGSGSTAIFSASGSITVDSSVTEIDGLFSADRNFTLNSSSNCPSTGDNQLIIQGSIIANAGRTGGTFINNRTLCGSNSLSPSVKFVERPDFMLNYPSVVIQTTRAWQDSAP